MEVYNPGFAISRQDKPIVETGARQEARGGGGQGWGRAGPARRENLSSDT